MTIVWPALLAARHMLPAMSVQSSLLAGFFGGGVVAHSICVARSVHGCAPASNRPGATQLISTSVAAALQQRG
jgi:hypothetical protein